MISRSLVAGLLAASCVTAAAGGAYVAVRQNAAPPPEAASHPTPAVQPPAATPAGQPVTETEAIVGDQPELVEQPEGREAPAAQPAPRLSPVARPQATRTAARKIAPRPAPAPSPEARTETAPPEPIPEVVPAAFPTVSAEPVRPPEPPAPPEPQFQEVVVPASSVIGLQVETALSSERARLEDRVDARVTRDVLADGRVAIPAGSRVIGAVTVVEKGGKVKERARLGVRFHTLVLANGVQVPLRTEAIVREGDSPSAESARKIGGAAIGGAILGAIMGGGKGAAIGGATGAGAGTAVVMAGDRNAATLPAGTIVTVRLSAPSTIEVEKRE